MENRILDKELDQMHSWKRGVLECPRVWNICSSSRKIRHDLGRGRLMRSLTCLTQKFRKLSCGIEESVESVRQGQKHGKICFPEMLLSQTVRELGMSKALQLLGVSSPPAPCRSAGSRACAGRSALHVRPVCELVSISLLSASRTTPQSTGMRLDTD